jgi:hypothetical protein
VRASDRSNGVVPVPYIGDERERNGQTVLNYRDRSHRRSVPYRCARPAGGRATSRSVASIGYACRASKSHYNGGSKGAEILPFSATFFMNGEAIQEKKAQPALALASAPRSPTGMAARTSTTVRPSSGRASPRSAGNLNRIAAARSNRPPWERSPQDVGGEGKRVTPASSTR